MPDTLDTARHEAVSAALSHAAEWTEAGGGWAELRSAEAKARAALGERRAELEALYERALAPDADWQGIGRAGAMAAEWGRAAAEKLDPQIDALRRKLAAPDGDMPEEVRRARRGSVEVAEAWLALHRGLRDRLLKLAAERRPPDAAMRARPVQGEIDYGELSREHIARYPKIRAALAK